MCSLGGFSSCDDSPDGPLSLALLLDFLLLERHRLAILASAVRRRLFESRGRLLLPRMIG